MKSLVESQLPRLFQADREGRFFNCSTFEEGCEVMKRLQDREFNLLFVKRGLILR